MPGALGAVMSVEVVYRYENVAGAAARASAAVVSVAGVPGQGPWENAVG